MILKKILAIGLCIVTIGACSKIDIDKSVLERMTDKQIYKLGTNAIENGNHKKAVIYFNELSRIYPYSDITKKSQLMVGFCHYYKREYAMATDEFESFMKLYPNDQDAKYAKFMIGICYYEKSPGIPKRNQDDFLRAKMVFESLIEDQKGNPYKNISEDKIRNINSVVGMQIMDIAMFYQKSKKYVPAIIRYRQLIDNDLNKYLSPECYYRIIECLLSLGLTEVAKSYEREFYKKHKETSWYCHATGLLACKISA